MGCQASWARRWGAFVILGTLCALGAPARAAESMSSDCYFDRAPGGCFERVTRQQKEDAEAAKVRGRYMDLMKQMSRDEMPPRCAIVLRGSNYAPVYDLSLADMKTCIGAAEGAMARNQQQRQRQVANYAAASRWQKVEADNGSVFLIDVAHITHYQNNGSAEIVVYAKESEQFDPSKMSRLLFDCRGHYMDLDHAFGVTQYAPPRSVVGQIGAIACGKS